MLKNKKKTLTKVKSREYPYSIWFLIGLIMLLVALIRIRILGVPLERDEGEYSYIGQLILQGIPPYKIAYNMKFPGTYYMYAFFMSIFGQTLEAVHIGLLIVNLASILLLFLLVKKLLNNYAAIVASASFALLTLNFSIFGFAAHATHFVILWVLAGTLCLYKAGIENKHKYYLPSGFLLGLVPIMKQPGIFFCFFGGLFLIIIFFINRKGNIKLLLRMFAMFIIGSIIPFITLIIFLKLYGVFDKFWYWTIEYALTYENQTNLKDGITLFINTLRSLQNGFYLIWIFALSGIIVLFLHPKLRQDFRYLFIMLFFIFSFLSICPGLYFREHYFVTLMPAISILFCVFIDYLRELSKAKTNLKLLKYLSYALFIISMTIVVVTQFNYFFQLSTNEISKAAFTNNPFGESLPIAEYIKANSKLEDKIAILGSEPQICFYANRHSASGYIYTYSLMEIQKNSLQMQKEMVNEIESALPKYLVYIHVPTSWHMNPNSETYIMKWVYPFLKKNQYQLKGIVDIYSDNTIYKWDTEIATYKARSDYYVLVFGRN
jgi:hypothetical protein